MGLNRSATSLECIFRQIVSSGEISLRALARGVNLRLSTVATKFRHLQRRGLVEFVDGRKRIAINRNYGHVVGIDMGASHLHFALADFRGDILKASTEKIRPEEGPRKVRAQIKQGIREITTVGRGESARQPSPLRAIGIGVPSAVDPKTRVVRLANNLPGWTNISLAPELEKEFRVPVFLENDVNMAAIGEHWRGVARGVENFIFIALGTGIGSGIFVNGKLYTGQTGSAGEIYRLNLEWPRWAEDFGDTGYLETYASGLGISAEGRRQLTPPSASGAAGGLAEEREAYFVFEAFRQGNPKARCVLEKIFTILGAAVANIVAILDPELIVFGGGIVRGAPELLLATVEKVVRRIQKDNTPPMKLSALENKAQTYGAIFSALSVAQETVTRQLR